MSIRQHYYPPLLEDTYYHIYNRGNNGDNLFYRPENYVYFLRLFDYYLTTYLETYAFCLLPNHFHLLIRTRNFDTLPEAAKRIQHGSQVLETPETLFSEQFRRFFIAYAKAIKKQEDRTGSLFEKNFRRKAVTSDKYFTNLVAYIHRNPQLHGIWPDFQSYPYSSYERMLLPKQTNLKKQEVLEWFGSENNYRFIHASGYSHGTILNLTIEE